MADAPFSPLSFILNLSLLQLLVCVAPTIPVILLCTYVYTSVAFYRGVNKPFSTVNKPSKPQSPPPLPYAVPWLGNTLSFLDQQPGRFWTSLKSRMKKNDACMILLGGIPTYVLTGAEGLFKPAVQKITDRNRFDEIVMKNGFGTGHEDYVKFHRTAHGLLEDGKGKMRLQDKLYHDFLLAPAHVNVLTSKFVETFRQELSKLDIPIQGVSVDLAGAIRAAMFTASTTAFMGSKVLELCPNWNTDFWIFDTDMLKLFYGLPRFMSKDVHNALQRLLDSAEKWKAEARKHYDAESTKDLYWEPWYGSRFMRERQAMYAKAGLSARGSVSPDLGFLFGLNANAVPATLWMLCHVLTTSDDTLLPELMAEVTSAQRADGSLDINKLVNLPLLSSLYSETLRLYVDVLVTRTVNTTFTMTSSTPGYADHVLKKDNVIMAPTYLAHHDADFWDSYGESSPGPEIWYARRFLHNGKFSTVGTNNKLFPYGGGNHMCPGRTFAKQEILAAFSTVLLTFDLRLLPGETLPKPRKCYNGKGVMGLDKGLMVRVARR